MNEKEKDYSVHPNYGQCRRCIYEIFDPSDNPCKKCLSARLRTKKSPYWRTDDEI
jgi:hypothetical protein